MKLSRASSYAVHALVYMAAQKHDRPIASHLVAAKRGIPERFLLKILKPLVAARILRSANSMRDSSFGTPMTVLPTRSSKMVVVKVRHCSPDQNIH